jgi:hypothetical protein
MPELLTSDHHALLFARGLQCRNYYGAAFRLKQAPDFDLEDGTDVGVKDNALRFVWLRRGVARIVPGGRLLEGLQVETSRLATQHSTPSQCWARSL